LWYTYPMDTMKTTQTLQEIYLSDCPIRQVLDRIADKWTTLVLGLLEERPMRFSELQRGIGGISQKMLTQTLRGLERDGLVIRTIYPEVPPHVEYRLSRLGVTLCGPIAAIQHWAENHIDEVISAQTAYDSRSVNPGGEVSLTVTQKG